MKKNTSLATKLTAIATWHPGLNSDARKVISEAATALYNSDRN